MNQANAMKRSIYHSPFPLKKITKFIYRNKRIHNGKVKIYNAIEILAFCGTRSEFNYYKEVGNGTQLR